MDGKEKYITEMAGLINALKTNSDEMIFTKDLNGVYTLASDAFAQLFGFREGEEIIGMDDFELTRSEEAANICRRNDFSVIREAAPLVNIPNESGALAPGRTGNLTTSKYPIFDDNGNVIGVLGLCRDVSTEEKYKKTAQEYKSSYESANSANNAKTVFLSRMSRDIRTPMNVITSLTSMAMMNLDDKTKVAECLRKINLSSKYLLDLINGVVDLQKIESGRAELNICDFDFTAFLDNVRAMMQAQAEEKKINLMFVTKKIENKPVVGDPTRIEQIFINLISNSIKFTPEGGSIRVTVNEKETKDDVVCFEVSVEDTGIGMSKDFIKHVFEPFAKNESGVDTSDGGIGLGLAVTRNLVKMMDGTISVESNEGHGTTFTFTICLLRQSEEIDDYDADKGGNSLSKLSDEDFSGKRALIVEDNELEAEIAKEILEMTGIDVERAENGKEAVDRFMKSAEGYYDVIFMDVIMPVMDGYEATRTIRKMKRADAASVPIIAMTASAFVSDVYAAKEAGMNEHIAKPIVFERLCVAMKKLIKK